MSNIEKAQQALREKRESGENIVFDPIKKAKDNPKSMRYAINAKCWDCCCGQRKEIRLCPSVDCSLHNFRPYK